MKRDHDVDCLIVGPNDGDFGSFVRTVKHMGIRDGAYRDLNLSFVTLDGKPYRSLDLLNRIRDESDSGHRPFSNMDLLWPTLTYLRSYLERRGFTTDHVNDFQAEKACFADELRSGRVRTVAITTTLYVWVAPILEIVEFVREHSADTKIIAGGPYIDNQAKLLKPDLLETALDSIGADIYVISAEGEQTLAEILGALRAERPLSDIENLVVRQNGRMIRTPARREDNRLEEERPDYTLFAPTEFNESVTLRTAKSCPFACAFCSFPQRAGRWRFLPVDGIRAELDAIRDIGSIQALTFIDDSFNVPKRRFKELLRMMVREDYGFRWNSYLRADHVDDECIELMALSGCEGVFLGVESGSDTMLELMNKSARRADYLRVIPRLRDAGIVCHANLIIGFPGETATTIRETIELVETAQPDFYRAQLWYCDRTTPIWERRSELQIQGAGFSWSHATMDARTASDWVERMFCEIENSIWLQQWGFEPWSIYYLQRRGMTMERVKEFLVAFNEGVRAKLDHPETEELSPAALEAVRQACVFEDRAESDVAERAR